MRFFLIISFLVFSNLSYGNKISDFQIEGFSIGQSLLNYMDEKEIIEKINQNFEKYSYLNNPTKVGSLSLDQSIGEYDDIEFKISSFEKNDFINPKDEFLYTIIGIHAWIYFIDDLDSCLKKKVEIESSFDDVFSFAEKSEQLLIHPVDETGRSKIYDTTYLFNSGAMATIQCMDMEEDLRKKNGWIEGLTFSLDTKDVVDYLNDY
jgi:hypothetical protein